MIVVHVSGGQVSVLEWLGVIIAVGGVFVTASDGLKEIRYGSPYNTSSITSLFGDSLCIMAGVFEVAVILNRHKIKPYVPLMQYTLVTTLIVAVVASLLSVLVEGSHVICFHEN